MVLVAMPVALLGIVLAAVAVAAVVRGWRGRLTLTIAAAVTLLLGGVFFFLGVSTLAELVGYPDDLMFLPGYMFMLLAFVPAAVAAALVGMEAIRYPTEEEEGVVDVEDTGPVEVVTATDEGTPREVEASGENDPSEDDTVVEEEPE